jgi:hypothetical protein
LSIGWMQLKEYIDDTEDFINIQLVSTWNESGLSPGQFWDGTEMIFEDFITFYQVI